MDLWQMVRELAISDAVSSESVGDEFDKVSYTVKTILQTGKEQAFSDHLAQFIAKKEDEIEKMCNFHYQEFVQSVEQLLKVRLGTAHLKTKIVNLNSEMQDAGTKILEKKKEVIEYRRILLNIELAMECVQTCLIVLDVANKINSQIEKGKHYSALRMLDDLQITHLPRISEYSIAKEMELFIPTQRENVREAVLKEIRQWLGSVNEKTRAVGKAALDISEKREIKRLENIIAHGHSISLDFIASEDMDVFDVANEHIDFKPLYKCIHIHDVLGKRNKFIDQFEGHRGTQADLLFESNFALNCDDLKGFDIYLQDAVGFFIVEAVIMSSTQNFRSRTTVEHLWEISSEKLNKIVIEGLQGCQNPESFFSIKQVLSAYVHTLQGYGYAVEKLLMLILSLFDRHVELTKMACCEQIIETVEDDDCTPVIVENVDEYRVIMNAIHFEDKMATSTFPRALPFSKTVPDCCYLIKAYVNGFYRFSNGFDQHHNEMDDLLKKSLEGILINTVGASLTRKMNEHGLGECIQIMTNGEYFRVIVAELEHMFTEKKGSNKGHVSLHASKFFADFRGVCEKRISNLVTSKIDKILDTAVHYEWMATTIQSKPSPYLQDIASFLNSLMSSELSLLSPDGRKKVYRVVLDHLANSLTHLLVSKSGKKISPQFVESFSKDIMFLENFINCLDELSRITDQFLELKQTVSFLLSEHYEDWLVPEIRRKKFDRVNATNLAILLEKIKPEATFMVGLTGAMKAKAKAVENVVKQIREPIGKGSSVAL
ncbi:exocyst complex subunit Sec15-like protein [Rhizoclosmatium globosum]|uniref:Exocyst complex component SEC15 n=1 Tax=Rhizoclosmatium globosum TaxID=329046 RepID=A0A1Y2CUN6_9FUNG|nr:exocyst complex subunit Sec15-like protein [Rhizoclosmatium globosum]|eukprot:ORY50770.1 exocyst complex subunit Sec15-like protein [Rhizoclosmatium globosum]